MTNQQILCDRCCVKLVLGSSDSLAEFISTHQEHNFTGLRVVKIDNPCPNRARDYTLAEESPVRDPADIEVLADLEHQSWSGWTDWMLREIERDASHPLFANRNETTLVNSVLSRLPCIGRWRRQMATSYADLSEKEKESDRVEARKKLAVYRSDAVPSLLQDALDTAHTSGLEYACEMDGTSWTGRGWAEANSKASEARTTLERALGLSE